MKNSLIILVGIPGSGKSTWSKKLFPDHVHVSSDAIRAELSEETDQTRNGEVFEIFFKRIGYALKAGRNVVADSTALDSRARMELRLCAAINGNPTHLIYFSNCDQAIVRNQNRDRVVPAHVMIRMLDKYERFRRDLADESKWYDSITEIRS